MQRSPPPFFKPGPSALLRLMFYAILAIVLMVVDARYKKIDMLRSQLSSVITPFQRLMLLPRDAWDQSVAYLETKAEVKRQFNDLERQRIEVAQLTSRAQQLAAENSRLRALLHTSQETVVPSVLVEVLYEARDTYTRRLIIDKGTHDGIAPGMPLIDDGGVAGQVVRVSAFNSEVVLLTDREQTIPVQVLRSGLRSIAFGGEASEHLTLRYVAVDADIQVGDLLITSGLDNVYPAGLPVAKVDIVEHDASSGFAKVWAKPVAGLDSYRHFLVLKTEAGDLPDLPVSADVKRRQGKPD